IEHNGQIIPLNRINTSFTKGNKIDLVMSGDSVVRMSYSKAYTGVITDISYRTNTIVLNDENFGRTTFTFAQAPYIIVFGKSTTSLGDLYIGAKVKLQLDGTQDKVQHIEIMQSRLFNVKDKQTFKLVVTDEAGKSHDVFNVSSVKVSHHNKAF